MKDIFKLMASLGVICAIGCAALVYVDRLTAGPRQAVEQAILQENLMLVSPDGVTFDPEKKLPYPEEGVTFHRGYADGRLAAVVAESSGKGFGGAVRVLVGLDPKTHRIVRVVVTAHTETPGLGTKATDRAVRKSLWSSSDLKPGTLPPNEFLDGQFPGRDARSFDPKTVVAVTGATYSSQGVRAGVHRACEAYRAHLPEM